MDNLETTLFDSRTGQDYSLRDAVLTSQPTSGGLYSFMPGQMPHLSSDDIKSMVGMRYQDVAKMILWEKFDWGIPEESVGTCIEGAYGAQWHRSEITPFKEVWENMYSLHLGYGPTFAFKNIALEYLPRILAELTKDKIIHVLWASSGDTINAAHHGVKWTNIFSLFWLPDVWPSVVQALQATNGIVDNPNALTILAKTHFDPLQDVVKKVNSPEYADLKAQYNITSFNSINIARILAQVVYYFRAYTELLRTGAIQNGDEIIFSVPSGNFGDALAGLYAREMWLPIKTINVATNENDMLHEFFQTGIYKPKKIHVSNAPSQDISKSSNFERALLWASWEPERVAQWYHDLSEKWSFQVDDETLTRLRSVFSSSTCTDEDRLNTIEATARVLKHGIDPHTATGVYPILEWQFPKSIPVIFLETSHVAQFGEELRSKGIVVPGMDEFDETLEAMKQKKPKEGVHFLRASSDPADIMEKVKQGLEILSQRSK